ncbi:MAG: hypothetical protein MI861_18010, partial [Pirellulales bacterium]|nr:hypothetical protein [Pirellulales bacterium]
EANENELEAVGKLVWKFKELLYETDNRGQEELADRLIRSLQGLVRREEVVELADSIPTELLREMNARWLPRLESELQSRGRVEQTPPLSAPVVSNPAISSPAISSSASAIAEEQLVRQSVRSGWYLDSSAMALRYRPSGHADALLKRLLDISSPSVAETGEPTESEAALGETFRQLASLSSVGRCIKCHSVDSHRGQTRINWQPYMPEPGRHDFTEFRHAPHLRGLGEQECKSCHELGVETADTSSPYRPEYHHWNQLPATDPSAFQKDFKPLAKSACVQCHCRQMQSDQCTTCHNYHVF